MLSSVTATVPIDEDTEVPFALVMDPLIAPVSAEPLARERFSVESLPTRTAPERACALAFRVAMFEPPLHPSSHTEIRTLSLSSLLIATPESVITAVVFVTWNTCPLLLVRDPPLMVKEEVPLSASPDIDW